jgi:hypothetical protein
MRQTLMEAKQIILVLDDDPAVTSYLKFVLEIEGFDVWMEGNFSPKTSCPGRAV